MKIALVHDYLREYGGAERVVEVFHEIWPDAPLYTSFVDWKGLGRHADRFKNWDIRTSWVQGNPFVKKFISPLRFLAPQIWNSLDLSGFDVILSSSGWFMCRGVNSQKTEDESPSTSSGSRVSSRERKTTHICYIHHPPRNLYGYATGSTLQKYAAVRAYAALINFYLRHYDFDTAQKVDYFIANSKETARRVEKFYRRDSTVIYPPIEVLQGVPLQKQGDPLKKQKYYISVGRLTYSKRIDLAIVACNTLKLPLKIVGVGKEMKSLKAIAGPTIEFMGGVSDSELDDLYTGAKALIFSALDEDFGMVPVEAMARGVPVIGLAQGGVKETVIEGKTGMLFEEPEVDSLLPVLKKFDQLKKDWSKECILWAKKFSKERFMKEITEFVEEKYSSEKSV
jgi:glycosyltransferase involved in cell wall biosynthesis